jgi:hypothetical protein
MQQAQRQISEEDVNMFGLHFVHVKDWLHSSTLCKRNTNLLPRNTGWKAILLLPWAITFSILNRKPYRIHNVPDLILVTLPYCGFAIAVREWGKQIQRIRRIDDRYCAIIVSMVGLLYAKPASTPTEAFRCRFAHVLVKASVVRSSLSTALQHSNESVQLTT